MCCSDKTRLWPPVKHRASLALIIDRVGAPLEGFTRGENITLTTSIVYHHWTLNGAQTKWSPLTKHMEYLVNLPVKIRTLTPKSSASPQQIMSFMLILWHLLPFSYIRNKSTVHWDTLISCHHVYSPASSQLVGNIHCKYSSQNLLQIYNDWLNDFYHCFIKVPPFFFFIVIWRISWMCAQD